MTFDFKMLNSYYFQRMAYFNYWPISACLIGGMFVSDILLPNPLAGIINVILLACMVYASYAQMMFKDKWSSCMCRDKATGERYNPVTRKKIEDGAHMDTSWRYSEEDLVSFANYVLSPERDQTIENENLKRDVGHWDVENWKEARHGKA